MPTKPLPKNPTPAYTVPTIPISPTQQFVSGQGPVVSDTDIMFSAPPTVVDNAEGTGTIDGSQALLDYQRDQTQRSGRAAISQVLDELGMRTPVLEEWAWGLVAQDATAGEILLALRLRPEYAVRFPGMERRRAAGLNPISEREYVDYETGLRQLFRMNGIPEEFYDAPDDIADLLGKDLALLELKERIDTSWARAQKAPTEVKEAWRELYGLDGDRALALFALDPEISMSHLERAIDAGFLAGTASLHGIHLGRTRAERLADFGISQPAAAAAFTDLDRLSIWQETISETNDLRKEEEGVDAAFGLDPAAAMEVKNRLEQRAADFGGGGGAVLTRTGTGLGGSRQR